MGYEGGGTVPASSLTGNSVVDRSLGVHEFMQLGHPDQLASTIVTPFVIVQDASAAVVSHTIFNANAPFAFRIIDVVVECVGANGSGTVKATDGTNDITDAMVCAVDKVIVRAGTIDDAYSTIASGGSLKLIKNAAADKGHVKLICVRTGA